MMKDFFFYVPEEKREEFERYLQRTKVMDECHKLSMCLLAEPEWPEDPIRYMANMLAKQVCGQTIDSIQTEYEETMKKIAAIKKHGSHKRSSAKPAYGPVSQSDAPVESDEMVFSNADSDEEELAAVVESAKQMSLEEASRTK